MKAYSSPSRSYEFYFPDVDTNIRVDTHPQAVIIRATRNTFTERRKRSFIHELAAEGFIPDDYEWLSLATSEFSRGVRWVIDFSWLKFDPAIFAPTNRIMWRILGGSLTLWITLMAVLILNHSG